MGAVANVLLVAGAYFFAKLARVYLQRFAGVNFMILFVGAFFLEILLITIWAIASR